MSRQKWNTNAGSKSFRANTGFTVFVPTQSVPDPSATPILSLPCCPCSRASDWGWTQALCAERLSHYSAGFRLAWRAVIEQKCTLLWLHYPGRAEPTLPILSILTLLGRAPGDTLQSCSLSIMPTFCFNIKGSSAILSVTLIALTSCGGTRHLMSKPIK